jgi:hypothetical protein
VDDATSGPVVGRRFDHAHKDSSNGDPFIAFLETPRSDGLLIVGLMTAELGVHTRNLTNPRSIYYLISLGRPII